MPAEAGIWNTQVADAAEIPRQRQLGDEMQQNDTHHPLAIHGNPQHGIRVGQQLRHALLDEAFGIRIAERVQQGGDRGGVLGGSGSDLDHVQARLWEKQRSVTVAAASAARWIAPPGSHDQ